MPGIGLFAELRRRHVWRVAVAYAIAAWLLVQIATQVFPFFDIPNWAVRLVVILLVIGFPVTVALAWVYEITPDGIRRSERPDSSDARPEYGPRQFRRKLNAFIAGALVLALAVLGARMLLEHRASSRTAAVAQQEPVARERVAEAATPGVPSAQSVSAKSIAVLPFENLSDDKQNEYFVAGIQDLILTRLADIGDLKVISRTSTAKYGSRPENLKTIAEQLGVVTILEGSVQKAGDRVLINVQLIDARNDSHLWAQDYSRKLGDIFGVEGEVAGKIAAALKAKLSPEESARLAELPTRNQAAYDLFLRAEYQANKGRSNYDTRYFREAIPLYEQAITHDPTFALAFAHLSHSQGSLAWFGGGGMDLKMLRRQARSNADRALLLRPDLAAAQIAAGFSDYYGRDDYAGAMKAFAAALALKPNDAEALAAQGFVQRRLGHVEAAIKSLERAFALDPRNSMLAYEVGATYPSVGDYSAAKLWYQRALALDPDNLNARIKYSDAIVFGTGNIVQALEHVQGDAPQLKIQRVKLLTWQRRYGDALALLGSVSDNSDDFSVGDSKAFGQAELYRLMGETAGARPLFRRALATARADLANENDVYQAFVWSIVAACQLGLGDKAAGLDGIAKSQAVAERIPDLLRASDLMHVNAMLYAEANRPDLAVPLLVKALAMRGIGFNYSPVLLWIDPAWDPIREDPGFRALLANYARYKPAALPDPTRNAGDGHSHD